MALGAALAVAGLLTSRVYGYLRGSARAAAFGVLATCALIAIHLVPAALGVLSRWSVTAAALVALLAAWRFAPGAAVRRAAPRGFDRSSGRLSWAFALAGGGLLALWSVTAMLDQWGIPPVGLDTVTHHLPNVGAWIQTGTVWRVDQFVPYIANGNYPHHGDLLFLATVLPWENDAFARPLNWVYVGLTALSVYAIAVEVRAPRAAAIVFAAAFCALPVVLGTAQSGTMTDTPMLAALGAGILFALRHLREERRADLVLAALALGVALGTKWYGASSAVLVIAVWIGARLALGGGGRRVAAQAGGFAGLALAAGGFWLVRNWVESGNPVYPAKVELLGATIFDAPPDLLRERYGATVFDYLTDFDVLRDSIFPAWRQMLNLPGLAIAVGAVVCVILAARAAARRREAASIAPLALAATALLLAAAYTVTPDTAFGPPGEPALVAPNSRYAMPALLAGAAAAAWAVGALGRAGVVLELLAFAGILQGLRRGFALERGLVAQVGMAIAVLAAVAWGWARVVRSAGGRRRATLVAVTAAVATLGVVAVGHSRQRDFNTGRYAATGDEALDWITSRAPPGARIALAGYWDVRALWPVWPAFGPRIENHVAYLGPTVEGQLRNYADARSFAAAFRRGRYDLLLVGRRDARAMPAIETRFDRWARGMGLELLARGDEASLYARGGTDLAASHRTPKSR